MIWFNAFIFVLLSAGHAELQVALLNRTYARPIGYRWLRIIGRLHDAAIFVVPLLFMWFAGLRGPALLAGGSWGDVDAAWWTIFGICGGGVVGLACSSIHWHLRRDPPHLESQTSTMIDVAERLGEKPIGDGKYRWSVRLPGNEVFQLDVCEKTLRLPRWPAEWDGLSILHLSDLHFEGTIDVGFFREVVRIGRELKPHLVIFTGDLLDRQELTNWLPETLGELDAPLGNYFVLGNHDWYLKPEETRRAMAELGWKDVAGTSLRVPGREIVSAVSPDASATEDIPDLIIAGDERPWMGRAPEFGPRNANDIRLLVSHSPDSLPWAKEQGVDLMLAGHVHGGQIVLPVIGPVYSPSQYGVKYASGVFWEEPTLLHVSRGISGKQPLRWNCRPELARLVIRKKR